MDRMVWQRCMWPPGLAMYVFFGCCSSPRRRPWIPAVRYYPCHPGTSFKVQSSVGWHHPAHGGCRPAQAWRSNLFSCASPISTPTPLTASVAPCCPEHADTSVILGRQHGAHAAFACTVTMTCSKCSLAVPRSTSTAATMSEHLSLNN